jgi:integrase
MAKVFRRRDRQNQFGIDWTDARGVRRKKLLGGSRKAAEEVAVAIQDAVNKEEFLGIVQSTRISFRTYANEWWLPKLRSDMSPRTKERFADALRCHLLPYFNKFALRSITAADVEAYMRKRTSEEGASPSSVNRELTVLKLIFRRAVSDRQLGRNPMYDNQGRLLDSVRPLDEPAGRVRYLAPEEIDRLLDACASYPTLREFTLLSLNTGCRESELLQLRYTDIDWNNALVRIVQTKNKTPKIVHLNDVALSALRALARRLDGKLWHFPSRNAASIAFRRATQRAQIANFRLHDCRHTYLSYAAMAGAQPRVLQELAGHKDPRMVQRYTHLSDNFLRETRNALQLGAVRPSVDPTAKKVESKP